MLIRIVIFTGTFIIFSIFTSTAFFIKRTNNTTDTITYTYSQLENLFLKNNFQLLSQKYNIEIKEAAVKQARLYVNPTLFYENVLYNPNNNTWFDNTGQNGERQIQLQQLILIGGKRSQLVKMAQNDKSIEEYAFYDLLRALRFQLISDYALIYFDLQKLKLLHNEEDKMKTLLASFNMQLKLGSVSAYEVTRIEFEFNSLKNDINILLGEIAESQNRIKVMTQLNTEDFIKPATIEFKTTIQFLLPALIDSAYSYRPDLKMTEKQIHLNQHSLKYERANAIPNITVGGDYDRFGNTFKNYTGINIALSLPVFDRNQGNIKIAEIGIENSKLQYQYNRTEVNQEVNEAYVKYNNTKELYNSITEDYRERLNSISNEAITRYNQRLINLLDFVDKIRTYKNGTLSIVEIEYNYFISCQYLNYVTNTNLF